MKKCLIRFHPSFLFVALGFILTGYFLNLIIFTSIIIVHELGHYLICKLKKFKVIEIVIYPYGGITKLEEFINRDIDDELLLATFGVIFQSLYFLIIYILFTHGLIRGYAFNIFSDYHYSILFFNLLPIYPLDGFRILNLFLAKKISYKKSNDITLYFSILLLAFLFIQNYYTFNYAYIIVLSTLISNIISFYKSRKYLFNRFLLERYLYNICFNNVKVIANKDKMHKNSIHIIKDGDNFLPEKLFLKKIFDKRY